MFKCIIFVGKFMINLIGLIMYIVDSIGIENDVKNLSILSFGC
jgi:type IV secretory pathway VirB3-like protein